MLARPWPAAVVDRIDAPSPAPCQPVLYHGQPSTWGAIGLVGTYLHVDAWGGRRQGDVKGGPDERCSQWHRGNGNGCNGAKKAGRHAPARAAASNLMLSCTDGRSEQWPTAGANPMGGSGQEQGARSKEQRVPGCLEHALPAWCPRVCILIGRQRRRRPPCLHIFAHYIHVASPARRPPPADHGLPPAAR